MIGTIEYKKRRPSDNDRYAVHPTKFTLWLFLVTVAMLFAAFTSGMLVKRTGDLLWEPISIPTIFTVSTIVIVLSSVALHWAYISAGKNEIKQTRLALWATFLLGITFVFLQYEGFKQLVANKVHMVGNNAAGSFYYVITGMHALHIIAGIFVVLATLIHAYQYKVHSKNMLRINMCATYWHFMGVLWIYLFAILNYYA